MATATKKAPAKKTPEKKTESASSSGASTTKVNALEKRVDALTDAVRRLASGAIVTEEHRDELFDLLKG